MAGCAIKEWQAPVRLTNHVCAPDVHRPLDSEVSERIDLRVLHLGSGVHHQSSSFVYLFHRQLTKILVFLDYS